MGLRLYLAFLSSRFAVCLDVGNPQSRVQDAVTEDVEKLERIVVDISSESGDDGALRESVALANASDRSPDRGLRRIARMLCYYTKIHARHSGNRNLGECGGIWTQSTAAEKTMGGRGR